MKAAVLREVGKPLEIEDVQISKPGPHEVLIRTVALEQDARGWRFEARAGGGITADSKPHAERLETEDKISAILAALTEQA